MNNTDRAVQFAPFASLRGYYGMIKEEETLTQPRRELSDDECKKLSDALSRIKKGDMLRVTYYGGSSYLTAVGMCTGIDLTMRILRILKLELPFESILNIETE